MLVLYLLWQLRPVLTALLKVTVETKEVLSALLERERARAERLAAADAARAAAAGADDWNDQTNPIATLSKPRAQTPPRGAPAGGYSTVNKKPGG